MLSVRHSGYGIISTPRPSPASLSSPVCFFFQAEDGIRDTSVTGVQTCALPISPIRKGLARPPGACQCGARALEVRIMIDLYYWTTPNGHKITMFLEETGLPYRIEIGRASCRERVAISGAAGSAEKQNVRMLRSE